MILSINNLRNAFNNEKIKEKKKKEKAKSMKSIFLTSTVNTEVLNASRKTRTRYLNGSYNKIRDIRSKSTFTDRHCSFEENKLRINLNRKKNQFINLFWTKKPQPLLNKFKKINIKNINPINSLSNRINDYWDKNETMKNNLLRLKNNNINNKSIASLSNNETCTSNHKILSSFDSHNS